jgi:enoyl-CoA hydratase/carnithine racemase
MYLDVLICSEDAKFGLPELKVGVMPGIGGT